MNYRQRKQKLERCEQLFEGRIEQTLTNARQLRAEWKLGWTPTRVMVAGAISGFVTGWIRPTEKIRAGGKAAAAQPRWIKLAISLTSLLNSIQATLAAVKAQHAAEAEQAAGQGDHEQAAEAASVAAASGVVSVAVASAAVAQAVSEPQVAPVAQRPADIPPADPADDARPRPDRRKPEPTWESQPSPAEAATEISER